MDIKIDTSELEKFAIKIKGKAASCAKEIALAIKKSTLSIERQAKQNLASNGSVKTGHLRRSITHKLSNTEGEVHTSNVAYAIGVEKGTRPHTIRPKNKKMLYWQGASHPVRQVNHPGSKAKPFLIPALEAEKPKFIQNLKDAIKLD